MPPKNALGKAKASLRPPTAKAKTKSKAKPKAKAKVGVGYTLVVAAGPNGELPEVKIGFSSGPTSGPRAASQEQDLLDGVQTDGVATRSGPREEGRLFRDECG